MRGARGYGGGYFYTVAWRRGGHVRRVAAARCVAADVLRCHPNDLADLEYLEGGGQHGRIRRAPAPAGPHDCRYISLTLSTQKSEVGPARPTRPQPPVIGPGPPTRVDSAAPAAIGASRPPRSRKKAALP